MNKGSERKMDEYNFWIEKVDEFNNLEDEQKLVFQTFYSDLELYMEWGIPINHHFLDGLMKVYYREFNCIKDIEEQDFRAYFALVSTHIEDKRRTAVNN